MSSGDGKIDPYEIVANAIGCQRVLLTPASAMKRTHGWDSLAHVSVVSALETAYGISISNDEMMELTSMGFILEFHQRQTGVNAHGE
ncbi:MAG: acyl carrier protein [Pirellulaceae bacterium]